eukprot:GILK01006149.1.p1 GENE.GILK01006149.1~~GILK01006149.1.p1  ORF type:complete len:354 (-),score=35.07 GILK01006149.1:114-1175(-)
MVAKMFQLPPALTLEVTAFLSTSDIVLRIGALNINYHNSSRLYVKDLEVTENTLSLPESHPSRFPNLRCFTLHCHDRLAWEKAQSSILKYIATMPSIRSVSLLNGTMKAMKLRPTIWQSLSKMEHLETLELVEVHPHTSAEAACLSCIESLMSSLRRLTLSGFEWTKMAMLAPRLHGGARLEELYLDMVLRKREIHLIIDLLTKLPELKKLRYNNLLNGISQDRKKAFCQQISNTIARYNPKLVICDVGANTCTEVKLLDPDRHWRYAGSQQALAFCLFEHENRASVYETRVVTGLVEELDEALSMIWYREMTEEERKVYALRVPKVIADAKLELQKCHTVEFLMSHFPPQPL